MTHRTGLRLAIFLVGAALLVGLATTSALSSPGSDPALSSQSVPDSAAPASYLLWTAPRRLNATAHQSVEPQIAIDTVGRVHVIWLEGEWGSCFPWMPWQIHHARRGSGGNWTDAAEIAQGIAPALASDGVGDVHLVWVDTRGQGQIDYYGVYHIRWDGDSRTWGPQDAVIEYPFSHYVNEWPIDTALTADSSGNLHVAWIRQRDNHRDLNYRTYDASSQTWSAVSHVADIGAFVTTRLDIVLAAGIPHLAWKDGSALRHTFWDAGAGAWAPATSLDQAGDTPSLAVTSDNTVHVACSEYHTSSNTWDAIYERWDGSTWTDRQTVNQFLGSPSWYAARMTDIVRRGNDLFVFWSWQELDGVDYDEIYYRQFHSASGQWEDYAYSVPIWRDSEWPAVAERDGHLHLAYNGWVNSAADEYDIFYSTTQGGDLPPWGGGWTSPTWTPVPLPPTHTPTPTSTPTPTNTPTPTPTPTPTWTPTSTPTPTPTPPQPNLLLTRGPVVRHGTGFSVSLNLTNKGQGDAGNISLSDTVQGFQVLPNGLVSNNDMTVASEYITGTKKCTASIVVGDLAAGASTTGTYYVVPALFESSITYDIGTETQITYELPYGGTVSKSFSIKPATVQVNPGDYRSIGQAVTYAIGMADYLLVTNPHRLIVLYADVQVQALLSETAELAYLKDGVLGYLSSHDAHTLDDLLEPAGAWGSLLHDDFRKSETGYLFIVGESEIVKNWNITGLNREWKDGSVTTEVPESDNPYADTNDDGIPDLVVGRAIGNTAAELRQIIQSSLGVHNGSAGYGFDRSYALLASGTDGNMQAQFVGDINTTADTLLEDGWLVSRIHWRDSAIELDTAFDYEQHDGFAAGDLTGDGIDELIVADRGDQIIVLDANLAATNRFVRDVQEGDRLAAGNVTGDAKEEIIFGDRNNWIYIYNASGFELAKFQLDEFAAFDGLACGDVTGTAADEIIIASRDDDYVYVYNVSGTLLSDFARNFEQHDVLIVGDVRTDDDDKEEIVIGDRSADQACIYEADGSDAWCLSLNVEQGDTLAVGDFTTLDYELAIADHSADTISVHLVTSADLTNALTLTIEVNEFDSLVAGRGLMGGDQDDLVLADRDDFIRMIDLSNLSEKGAAFASVVSGADLIVYSGHGEPDGWDGVKTNRVPNLNLGSVNPFVLGFACLSGSYSSGHDKNFSDAWMANSAGVYVGSTQLSPSSTDSKAIRWFFDNWTTSQSVGDGLIALERDKFSKSGWWQYWVYEYNLYGDPKFGATTTASANAASASEPPPSSLDITIPPYTVTSQGNFHEVLIPDGDTWFEDGEPQVPFYSVVVECPKGVRAQAVTLVDRSGLITDSGLNIPLTEMRCAADTTPAQQAAVPQLGWFPDRTYDWLVIENPDGSSTLLIKLYPFLYDAATTDVQFYTDFDLALTYAPSTVEIVQVDTDQPAYMAGDTVSIQTELLNSGPALDVSLETSIVHYPTGQHIATLLPTAISGLAGELTTTTHWQSGGTDPGWYAAEVIARDTAGNTLDRSAGSFNLGITSATVTALTATPQFFAVGTPIETRLSLHNDGSEPISGQAVVQVQTEAGELVAEFRHDITNFAPATDLHVNDVWDTTGVAEGSYRIIGYLVYDGGATEPKDAIVRTGALRCYLPLILRGYPPPPTPTATAIPSATPWSGFLALYDRGGVQNLGLAEDWESTMTWQSDGQARVVADPKSLFGQVAQVYVRGYGHGTETSWVKAGPAAIRGPLSVPAGADLIAIPCMTVLNEVPGDDSEAGIEIAVSDPVGGQPMMTYASHILDTELRYDYIVAFADVSEFGDQDVSLTITLRQTDICGGANCTHDVDLYIGDLWFESLPDICTTEPDGSHTLYDYYDDPSPHLGADCADPQPYYFLDLESGPYNAYGVGDDDHQVSFSLPPGAEVAEFQVYYGRYSHGFTFNGHELSSSEVYDAFPIRKGTYVNISEPGRWMPANDNPGIVAPWLVSGQNTFVFNVYANDSWWERPFDLWARFRLSAPTY